MTLLGNATVTKKSGGENLYYHDTKLNATLLDFWRWSASDILSNATRGIFAEFIVATATGISQDNIRDEWGAYDLLTPEGIKLEIKSAAYLQTWAQKVLSIISFSIKPARHWDPETNLRTELPKRHADVYVFCLLKHEDKATVDPLNLDHWDFYVLSTIEIDNYTRSQHSITLNSLQKLTVAVGYDGIRNAVGEKHKLNLRV